MSARRSWGYNRRASAGWRLRGIAFAIVAVFATAVAVEADQLAPDAGAHRSGASPRPPSAVAPGRTAPASGRRPAPNAVATVSAARGVAIPRSYLGVSIETWDLLRFDRRPAVFRRVLRLLGVRGDGPLVLRLGGNSADRTWWRTPPVPGTRLPYRIADGWLLALRRLTAADHLRLLLDLNLAADDPAMALAFVRAARSTLPAGSIEAFEVGNEPDLYRRGWFDQMAALTGAHAWRAGPWQHYAGNLYTGAFRTYARTLEASVARAQPAQVRSAPQAQRPAIPLAGPELADPVRDFSYARRLVRADRRYLRLLTAHSYRYSACSQPSQAIWPTIQRLLSPEAASGVAAGVKPLVRLAARAGLPFRLTELNSVTCGGRAGVSDTFATALWAPSTLFSLLKTGVGGVNIHVRENKLNQAFAITARGLRARPLLYGLLAFARTLDGGRELLAVRLRVRPRDHVSVWAVRTASGALHVLALDKGPRAVWLALRLPSSAPSSAPATVARLTAPSVRARSGVTFAGQRLDGAARWIGRAVTERLAPGRHGYELRLAPGSAALVVVPAAGA